MKKIIFFILLIITFSKCQGDSIENENSTKTDHSFEVNAYHKEKINFYNHELFIPNNYAKTSIDNLIFLYENNDDISKEGLKNWVNNFKGVDENSIVFIDKKDPFKLIWVHSSEYIELTKAGASVYLGYLENVLAANPLFAKHNTSIIEKRFIKTQFSNLIKIKILSKPYGTDPASTYYTQYFITSKKRSIVIEILNDNEVDYEEVIKSTYFCH